MTYRNRIKEHLVIDSSELRRNPLNHRRHPDSQRHALRQLLGSVGVIDELLAYRDPEHGLTLVDGEARWSEGGQWPVAVLDLTPDEARLALAMLDRIGAQAEIDPEALLALLDSLPAQARTTAGAAWSDAELAGLIGSALADQPEEDAPVSVDETKPTRCQAGDVWRIGRHTAACLDSTDRENVERLLSGRTVGMVWSDPPYGVQAVGKDGRIGSDYVSLPSAGRERFGGYTTRQYAPVIGDDTTATARTSAALLLPLFEDARHVWWGAQNYADALPPSQCWIVWDKKDNGPDTDFADGELAWVNAKTAVRFFRHLWMGITRASESQDARVHPTQKPIALCAWAFEKYGSAGDLIFDPFLGSGPSLKAAEQSNRTVIGCELSPHYIDHLLEWGESHGLTVTRDATA